MADGIRQDWQLAVKDHEAFVREVYRDHVGGDPDDLEIREDANALGLDVQWKGMGHAHITRRELDDRDHIAIKRKLELLKPG